MTKNPLLMLIGIGGFIFIAFMVVDRWDNDARFFRSAMSLKSHYNFHKDEFAVLAKQLDVAPPLGENDLCLKASCMAAKPSAISRSYSPSVLQGQRDFYTKAIADLDFPDWVFALVKEDGEVISMGLSWPARDYFVNASLHYTGGEQTSLSACDKAPSDGGWGECALDLDDDWLVKYAWMPNTAFDPKPGTAQAECDSAKNQSFAAYSECLEKSPAPRIELECQDEDTIEELTLCMDNMIARKKRGQ
ncbi:hypothetical protein [Hyphomonas oceanitis]|uniref:hypothetical protein n=1 Tax=Hyphomonas oceanitis TaxID=81033 RepID=UPI0030025B3A